jgi:hypothetical protein
MRSEQVAHIWLSLGLACLPVIFALQGRDGAFMGLDVQIWFGLIAATALITLTASAVIFARTWRSWARV